MLIHVLRTPSNSVSRINTSPEQDEWIDEAIKLFKLTDHYYEVSDEEFAAIESTQSKLYSHRPTELEGKNRFLRAEEGFMGEHIVLINGEVTKTSQTKCPTCRKYHLAWCKEYTYCFTCEKNI